MSRRNYQESLNSCKVFCENHQNEISHIYVGDQSINLKIFCEECLRNLSSEIKNEIIQVNTAMSQFAMLASPIQQYFKVMNNWLETLNFLQKNLKGILENQIKCIDELIQQITKAINEEQLEINKILSNINNLTLIQLKIFSQIRISKKENQQVSSQKLEENLQQIFYQYEVKSNQLQKEQQNLLKNLNQKLSDLLVLSQELQNQEISILQYSKKEGIVVAVHTNTLSLYYLISEQFQGEKTIQTDHSQITALTFADNDNNNKLYLAGEEMYISSWLWENKLKIYVYENKFQTDHTIKKMIQDYDYGKTLAFSENFIEVYDMQKMKIDHQLTDLKHRNNFANVYCSDISSSGLLLICTVDNYLILWKKFAFWKAQIQFPCLKQNSICFIHNSQFVSLSEEGKFNVWEITENTFHLIQFFDSTSTTILYCRSVKTLVCFNEISYKLYQIKQNRQFEQILEKKGKKKLKLCTSSEGDILVIVNDGLMRICFTNRERW